MKNQHQNHEDRLEQQYRRLGTRQPVCVECAEADPFCLELHHIAGRKHHDDVSIVCRNCHRKLTDQQHDHVPHTTAEPNGELATIGRYLLGLCDLLAMIVETLRNFGKWLISESQCGEPA